MKEQMDETYFDMVLESHGHVVEVDTEDVVLSIAGSRIHGETDADRLGSWIEQKMLYNSEFHSAMTSWDDLEYEKDGDLWRMRIGYRFGKLNLHGFTKKLSDLVRVYLESE